MDHDSVNAQVVRWAKYACEKSGEDPNDGANLRSKLGTSLLRHIRFTAMSMNEFREFVGKFFFKCYFIGVATFCNCKNGCKTA